MPFVDGFRNDIFVSYAHADNEEGIGSDPWVSQLVRYLDTSLRQRLGCGEELRVFFDRRDLTTNHELESMLKEARASAVFLAVLSPSYVKREWTRKELDAFAEQPEARERLFALELLPLDSPDDYPEAVRNKIRARFWQSQGLESRTAVTIEPSSEKLLYGQRLLDLADQIKQRLQLLKGSSAAALDTCGEHAAEPAKGTVLLAQVTDELELEREQVLAYLKQEGIRVLPDADYPQGGEEFTKAFADDLETADIVVQLLGSAAGRRPPDLPDGYAQQQYNAASASGKPLLIWRHPLIDTDLMPSSPHKTLLMSKEVIVSGLESFKTEVVRNLKATQEPEPMSTPSMIYIGADRSDLSVAQQIQEMLREHNFPVSIPTFEGTSEEIRQDLEESLADSDTLVFVHGVAPVNWVRGNLRRMHKLLSMRDTPPQAVAILKTPPQEKADIGMALPYVKYVDCTHSEDFAPLLSLLEGRG